MRNSVAGSNLLNDFIEFIVHAGAEGRGRRGVRKRDGSRTIPMAKSVAVEQMDIRSRDDLPPDTLYFGIIQVYV